MDKITNFLIEIAKESANLITEKIDVYGKGDFGDLVTNFDYKIEEFIISKIKEHYPTFDIISEEYNFTNKLTKNCFIIDPIDGTINFAHNIPIWAIQLACIKNGSPCAAVIYLPKLNEIFYADKKNSYLNNKIIHVSDFKQSKNFCGIEGPNKPELYKIFKKISSHLRSTGSAGVSFAWAACGKFDAACFTRNNLWDFVPGLYIAKKAGLYIVSKDKLHIAAKNKELATLIENEFKN